MSTLLRKYVFAVVLTTLSAIVAAGQSDSIGPALYQANIFRLIKDDSLLLLNQSNTSISDLRQQDVKEAPGTITIVTAEQIQAMGASDLLDVLVQIPGIQLGRDVEDVVGIGIRGLWAHEGKMLYMINGIPLNEMEYGTFALGNRIPLENINRIEIMTGPGSVMYGGTAALGVVNIITYSAADNLGTFVQADAGRSNGFNSRRSIGFVTNAKVGKYTFLSINANASQGLKSTYRDAFADGSTLSYGDSTRIQNITLHFDLTGKNFRTQAFFNDYSFNISDASHGVSMKHLAMQHEVNYKLFKTWDVKSSLLYQYQMPWFYWNNLDSSLAQSDTYNHRVTFNTVADHRLGERWNILVGLQGFTQQAIIFDRSSTWNVNGENEIYVYDAAALCELNYKGRWGNFKAGGRMERNTLAPLLASPRISWTLVKPKYFIKALFSNAYKIPTLQNINLGPSYARLQNERVQSIEVSTGISPTRNSQLELTLFNNEINQPIVYVVDSIRRDNYDNRPNCGTYGIELRYSLKTKHVLTQIGASYYRPNNNVDLPEVVVQEHPKTTFLGMPAQKVTGSVQYLVSKSFTAFTSGIFQSHHYTYLSNEAGELMLREESSALLINVGCTFQPTRFPGFRARFCVNNILNQRFVASSAYNNDLLPLPLFARGIVLSIQYRLNT